MQALRHDLRGISEIVGKDGKAREEAEKEYQNRVEQMQIKAVEQKNHRLSIGNEFARLIVRQC